MVLYHYVEITVKFIIPHLLVSQQHDVYILVIRSKRRKRFEKQRLNAAQNLIKEVKVKDPVHPAKAGSP